MSDSVRWHGTIFRAFDVDLEVLQLRCQLQDLHGPLCEELSINYGYIVPTKSELSEIYVDERYVRWARVLDELEGDSMTMPGIAPGEMVLLNEEPFHNTVCSSQICRRISAGIPKS